MEVVYIDHYGTDLTVANAARVSFDKHSDSLSKQDEKLIHYLAKHKHTSCFEHMGATLKLKVPIFIARQIQRHRTFSYNEISRRYVDNEPEFCWPETWRKRAENAKQGSSNETHPMEILHGTNGKNGVTDLELCAKETVEDAVSVYNILLQQGVAPEQARMILPQNMYTEFYMSGNLRAWAHFLHLRLDGHAQKEVRDVAEQVAAILTPLYPVSMQAILDNPA